MISDACASDFGRFCAILIVEDYGCVGCRSPPAVYVLVASAGKRRALRMLLYVWKIKSCFALLLKCRFQATDYKISVTIDYMLRVTSEAGRIQLLSSKSLNIFK